MKIRCCILQNFIHNDQTLKFEYIHNMDYLYYFQSPIIENIDVRIDYNLNFYISSNYFYKNFDSYPNFFEITEENNEKEEKMS